MCLLWYWAWFIAQNPVDVESSLQSLKAVSQPRSILYGSESYGIVPIVHTHNCSIHQRRLILASHVSRHEEPVWKFLFWTSNGKIPKSKLSTSTLIKHAPYYMILFLKLLQRRHSLQKLTISITQIIIYIIYMAFHTFGDCHFLLPYFIYALPKKRNFFIWWKWKCF